MAKDGEDVIFSLKVEPGDAFNEMEKFKKAILQTKEEQQLLTKALKAGDITMEEYVKEGVRLEANLKRNQSVYNNLQKSVTGVKTQLDKLIDSNKKISKSFGETASQINVAGFNVGDLTKKFTSFLNPTTAALGVVTALVGAYAKSSIGARDLALATDALSSGFQLAANSYGDFVSELKKDKDSGFFEDASFAINQILFGTKTANQAKAVAAANEQIRLLAISGQFAKGFAKDREREAENARRIRDDETKTLTERLKQADIISEKLTNSEQLRTVVLQAQIEAIKDASTNYKLDYDAQLKVAQVTAEIKDIEEEINGKLTENIKARETIIRLANDPTGGRKLQIIPGKGTESDARQAEKDFQDFILSVQLDSSGKQIETHAMTEEEKTKATEMGVKNRIALDQEEQDAKLLAANIVLDSIANLASEGTEIQKIASLLSIQVSTAEAVTKGIAASQSIPFPGNLVAMASTIAAVLGAIANAKSTLGFAEGGWTGPGDKYKPVGIVHADEYVVPKHIVHSPTAQHHLTALEAMRMRGYADGGLAVNSLTNEVNQSLMIKNIMKDVIRSMPAPEVSVKQIIRAVNSVNVKQDLK